MKPTAFQIFCFKNVIAVIISKIVTSSLPGENNPENCKELSLPTKVTLHPIIISIISHQGDTASSSICIVTIIKYIFGHCCPKIQIVRREDSAEEEAEAEERKWR